jgi:hypothetical protein
MRDVNSLPGLHKIRTMFSAKKRSIPRVQSSTYLDLYMMNKEKERLLKESERVGMRDTGIKKRLEEIDLEMNRLQGVETPVKSSANLTSSSERIYTQRNGVKKEWKKMSLNY